MTTVTPRNRTGTRAAPERLEEMRDTDDLAACDQPAPGPSDTHLRQESIEMAMPIGSSSDQDAEPDQLPVLDALAGRLAFERGGVRLYDALLRKAEALAHLQGLRECVTDLEHIRDEEVDHVDLLQRIIEECDGDPTLETPCADLEGVMSSGLLEVAHDPRTTLLQCLRAAQVAELADVENWTALLRRLEDRIDEDLLEEAGEALEHEQEHLDLVRKWITVAETPAPAAKARRAQGNAEI
jgi:rubrerythrin